MPSNSSNTLTRVIAGLESVDLVLKIALFSRHAIAVRAGTCVATISVNISPPGQDLDLCSHKIETLCAEDKKTLYLAPHSQSAMFEATLPMFQ